MLSPAYDINPDENGTGLKLNISEDDNSLDYDLAISVAPYYRLSNEQAKEIVNQTTKIVSGWDNVAQKYNISRNEREFTASAFRY